MLRRALLSLLVWALLAAPTLGVLHRAVHLPAPLSGALHSTAAPTAAREQAATHLHASDGIAALFAHTDEASCRLYDQLAQGDVLSLSVLPLVALPPSVLVVALHGLGLARWAALFDARGPPSLLR